MIQLMHGITKNGHTYVPVQISNRDLSQLLAFGPYDKLYEFLPFFLTTIVCIEPYKYRALQYTEYIEL